MEFRRFCSCQDGTHGVAIDVIALPVVKELSTTRNLTRDIHSAGLSFKSIYTAAAEILFNKLK